MEYNAPYVTLGVVVWGGERLLSKYNFVETKRKSENELSIVAFNKTGECLFKIQIRITVQHANT